MNPESLETLIQTVIVGLVPAIVSQLKNYVPNWVVPLIALATGAGLQAVSSFLASGVEMDVFQGLALGGLGVFLREFAKHWSPERAELRYQKMPRKIPAPR